MGPDVATTSNEELSAYLHERKAMSNSAGLVSGNRLASPATEKSTELTRLANGLQEQDELLEYLRSRLAIVSHHMPSDTEKGTDNSLHISSLADRVMRNNDSIRYLLDTLAV